MNAKEIRDCLPRLENERILNVCYQSDELYGVVAMLAESEGEALMWEICRESENTQRRRKWRVPHTKREALKNNFRDDTSPFIRSLRIGDQIFSVSSATGGGIGEDYHVQEKTALFYMISQGVNLGRLEEDSLEKLAMRHYRLENREGLQCIPDDVTDVEVELSEQHISVPVHKRMRLRSGRYKIPRVIKIDGEEELIVYIHGISYYDIWEQAEIRFQDKWLTQRFTEEEIQKIKQQYMENLPSICPKGYVIPLIEYECSKNYQMQFYTLEFLRKKPENNSTSMLLNMKSDKENGPMGFKLRACPLDAVQQGCEESMDVELFLYYRLIPKKIIKCHSTKE